jgi:hypothetical protein
VGSIPALSRHLNQALPGSAGENFSGTFCFWNLELCGIFVLKILPENALKTLPETDI